MVKLNWEKEIKHNDQDLADLSEKKDPKNPEELIYPKWIERSKNNKPKEEKRSQRDYKYKNIKWINKLFLGDNKSILNYLLKDYKKKIDLIYFDPPFFTNSNYYHKIFIGNHKKSIKSLAYQDRWSKGLDSYLNFLYERILLMKKLLSFRGSIYVHLDYHVSHYIKIIMDEIFGTENFRNEIIWHYPAASARTKRFYVRSYDSILFYTKSDDYIFNDNPHLYIEYSKRVKDALKRDEKGVYYHRGGSHDGVKLSQKVYVEKRGVFPPRDVWTNIPYIRANTSEYQGFSTQKPERLLKRIILASSKKDSIVADFFIGSGTTVAVAEKLGRKWIGSDLNWHSIHTTRKRLLDIDQSNDLYNWEDTYNKGAKPFEIYCFKKNKIDNEALNEFISESNNNNHSSSSKKQKLDVNLIRTEDKIRINIVDYHNPYENYISKKLSKKINDWQDWIDYIAVNYIHNSEILTPIWCNFRTPKNRDIILDLELQGNLIPTNLLTLQVVDILGFETLKKIEIN